MNNDHLFCRKVNPETGSICIRFVKHPGHHTGADGKRWNKRSRGVACTAEKEKHRRSDIAIRQRMARERKKFFDE
jgi:hypothetical protein